MVDTKYYKPVSASFSATATAVAGFPAPVVPGTSINLAASTVGVLFTTLANSDGAYVISIIGDNAAAPATPVGVMVEGVFVTPLPTYASGDAAVAHMDSRGRLIVSLANPGSGTTVDVDQDDTAAPANPTGIWTMLLYDATLPTYATGDATAMHADDRGRMLVSLINPTTGATVEVDQDGTTASVNPTGIWTVGMYDATLPTYSDGDAAVLHTSVNGELLTLERLPGSSSVSSVAATAVNTTLIAANTARRGAMVFNDSATATLFLKLGATASATSYTVQIPPNNYYELPSPVYTGIVDGIWSAAVGDARITELTV